MTSRKPCLGDGQGLKEEYKAKPMVKRRSMMTIRVFKVYVYMYNQAYNFML